VKVRARVEREGAGRRVFLRMQATSVWLTMPMRISVCLVSLRSCVRADLVRVWLNALE
jgi:hypothetical protein